MLALLDAPRPVKASVHFSALDNGFFSKHGMPPLKVNGVCLLKNDKMLFVFELFALLVGSF